MRKMAVVVNYTKSGAKELTQEICVRLRNAGLQPIFIQERENRNHSHCEEMARCEAMIAIGGDGTILGAARLALQYDIPVLGVNAGRLGFLAGLERHEIDMLSQIATGEYTLHHRMLLEATVLQDEQLLCEQLCVNDAVVSRYASSRLMEIPVTCDGHTLNYRGDGVIFSTPTGSTAYGFSAGGSVVDPRLEAILLTPICNHRLFNRSIVFAPDARFKAEIAQEGMALTYDGEQPFMLSPGQTVTVRRAEQSVRFIQIKKQSFLDILNKKLISK